MPIETKSRTDPDSKVHGANMGPIWGRQDPGGPHVGPMNFTIVHWKPVNWKTTGKNIQYHNIMQFQNSSTKPFFNHIMIAQQQFFDESLFLKNMIFTTLNS